MERSPRLGEHALEQGSPWERARGPELPLAALKGGRPPSTQCPTAPPQARSGEGLAQRMASLPLPLPGPRRAPTQPCGPVVVT